MWRRNEKEDMGMLIEEGKGNNRVKKLRTDNNPLINRTQGSEKNRKIEN